MQLTKHWAATLDDYVIDLAWAPDGGALAAASAAGGISVFGAKDGARIHAWAGHDQGTNCLAFSPAGVLASGGQDGCVKFWDAAAGQHVATTNLGAAWVEHIAWKPAPAAQGSAAAGRHAPVLAAAAGRKLSFLAADGALLKAAPDAPKTISAIAWHPSGGAVAAGAFGGVRLWDGDDFLLQKELIYNNGIQALAWSPDGKWLVSGNSDPSVHLWTPETDLELHMSGYESKVRYLSFDATSRWLATGGGHDASLWDCAGPGPEGRAPEMLPHEAPVCAVAFQHRHGLLASASADGVVLLWSPERQQPLRATVRLPSPAAKLAWAPDDTLLALGAESGALFLLRCEE